MVSSYRYTLKVQDNGWFLVRFPAVPEALTEGETEEEAVTNAKDCLLTALDGYALAGKALPEDNVAGPETLRLNVNKEDFTGRLASFV